MTLEMNFGINTVVLGSPCCWGLGLIIFNSAEELAARAQTCPEWCFISPVQHGRLKKTSVLENTHQAFFLPPSKKLST